MYSIKEAGGAAAHRLLLQFCSLKLFASCFHLGCEIFRRGFKRPTASLQWLLHPKCLDFHFVSCV